MVYGRADLFHHVSRLALQYHAHQYHAQLPIRTEMHILRITLRRWLTL
jgi:hypothetical protein